MGGPRQQIPHFVRPCENEDERVIAFFLYYIRHCIFFLYIIFVGFLSCLEFLIDWNEYMFANKPEGIRRNSNRRSDEFLFPGLWNFGFPKIRKHYFHVSVIVFQLADGGHFGTSLFFFSPTLLTLCDCVSRLSGLHILDVGDRWERGASP